MELPKNDAERLATLYKYGVLDTDFEERFDRLTRVAAAVFGTPISLISLVDRNRQWFKSALGLKVRETPRDISFCTHAILAPDVFVVLDAQKDERFSRNPLVTGDPNIRFYAGAPLVARNGHALGTFCIIDSAPRAGFSDAQQGTLRDFADAVVDFFELQYAIRDARANRLNLARDLEGVATRLSTVSERTSPNEARAQISDAREQLLALAGQKTAEPVH